MQEFKEKLRRFLVRSARDVASQALPNWAQIGLSLAQNFHDIFIACPAAEQAELLRAAREVTEEEWRSIRGQVAARRKRAERATGRGGRAIRAIGARRR